MACFRCKRDGHDLGCDPADADLQCEICGVCAANKLLEAKDEE